MRDKNRIRPFLNRIAEEWEKHPDLRFGQFVMDVIPDQDKLWNGEENEFLRRLNVFANRASGNKAGTADNNRPVMTKDLNTFDNTPRKIRCIGRKHDFLGDGHYFTEEELEIGKEGFNPLTGETKMTTRKRIHVDYELPLGDEYGSFIRKFT